MKYHKILVTILALSMIVSGLAFVSVGSDPVPEPRTVPRVAFAEDFTNWGCGPCASHNPEWTAAIRALGYNTVAPAYTHVHWPSSTDPMNNYADMNTWANNRRVMYGISGVPSAWLDGANIATMQSQAAYETAFNNAAAIPADIEILTSGYINPTSGFGTLDIHVEAVENLPAGDYRLIVYLWEDEITRTLNGDAPPYPNGESQLDWAVWLMIPDEQGQAIFQSGATIGDYVDVNHNFVCEPEWDLTKMGSTVFVQRFDTLAVEQAAVELYNDPVPTHDVSVGGDNIEDQYDSSGSYMLDCTVYNPGNSGETNVEVALTLDGIPDGTQIIPNLPSGTSQPLTFPWTAPAVDGSYVLGFEVTPVTGETATGNNIWTKTIDVVHQPDIWLSPGGFDFTVTPGGTDNALLTVGNTGPGVLNWDVFVVDPSWPVVINEFCTGADWAELYNYGPPLDMTGWSWWWHDQRNYEGVYNFPAGFILDSHATVVIDEVAGTDTDDTLYMNSNMMWSSTSAGIAGEIRDDTGAGVDFFRTAGDTRTPTAPGVWNAPDITHPNPDGVGSRNDDLDDDDGSDWTVTTGSTGTRNGLNPGQTGDYPAALWCSVAPSTGTTSPYSTATTTVTVDATGIPVGGPYQLFLAAASNDPDTVPPLIPVNMTVSATGPPLVDLTAPDGGEAFMGGDTTTITWDMSDNDPLSALVVNLYYSTDGGSTYPNTIATGLTGFMATPCTYDWNPIPMEDSTQVRVMVEVVDTDTDTTTDESAGDFEIDSTAPAPATNVHAELFDTHVRIYWDASVSSDILYYEVWFVTNNFDPTAASYGLLSTTPGVAIQHSNVGINNPSSYFYQVRAYDNVGHETIQTIQAAKIGTTQSTFTNPSGWFMLGSPLVQSDISLAHIIQGQGLPASNDYLQMYDAFDAVDPWKSYMEGRPASVNDMAGIDNDQAFWMHVTGNTRWATAGYVSDMTVPMRTGWNLVPYPFAVQSMTASAIDAHLTANCPNYDDMRIFDTADAYRVITPTGAETITLGSGLWVHVTADSTWTATNY